MDLTQKDHDHSAKKNIEKWLHGSYDSATKEAIRHMEKEAPQELLDAFYTTLAFGTGGMRGIMGIGSNRINVYTVRAATQGLANYLKKHPQPGKKQAVFISYDSRHHSRTFAEETAKVFAGNGFHVYLTKELRPSPLVSFSCRDLNCSAAVLITASHNPAEYNGYKVYWSDGAQVLPPHDSGIIEEVNKIEDPAQVKSLATLIHPMIEMVADQVDDRYLEEGSALQLYPNENRATGNRLKIIYTSLHGTGITLVPQMLQRWGFEQVHLVNNQVIPDGNFSTTPSPNPEEKEALILGIEELLALKGDILIATDPDADRVGVAVAHQGRAVVLTGNQIACLCLDHICKALSEQKRMPPNAAFIKTIATTELFKAICDNYDKPCINVSVGFKYVAEKINKWESSGAYTYIFGGEESFGYLLGTITRDKDGVLASALICEVALAAKNEGKTLVDKLYDLYTTYGIFSEGLRTVHFPETQEGKKQITERMSSLRTKLPAEINGVPIAIVEDYLTQIKTEIKSGKTSPLHLTKSNVLLLWLEDGSKIMIRPSGTEPKIKLYGGTKDKSDRPTETAVQHCQAKIDRLLDVTEKLLTS